MKTLPSIEVKNLTKTYKVGEFRTYDTLRDQVAAGIKTLLGRSKRLAKAAHKTHTALNAINFEVQPGEILGVIGKNGAGKSTLLKMLARVTAPTAGEIVVRGRLAPLLEVGTGFNVELTGRENIFVNGTLLGMARAEIDAKLDSIIAFAGVEEYIDTPVKRYSSGMVVRLGFAIAAHLEPEIMLVDEVLAVGDAAFQKRCLGKMNDISKQGRTIIFVSHNMEAMQGLCSRVIWIDDGQIRMDGSPREVVSAYLTSALGSSTRTQALPDMKSRRGNKRVYITFIKAEDKVTNQPNVIGCGSEMRIDIGFSTREKVNMCTVWLWLKNRDGTTISGFNTNMKGITFNNIDGDGIFHCNISKIPYTAGDYFLDAAITSGAETCDEIKDAFSFEIIPGDYFGNGGNIASNIQFLCEHDWSLT